MLGDVFDNDIRYSNRFAARFCNRPAMAYNRLLVHPA